MGDEIRTSVDLIAVTQAASAIASADAKRAAGKTKGKHMTAKQLAADAKVSFFIFFPLEIKK